jgi:predicted kinase
VPFEALAAAMQVPFSIIDCVAPLPALHRRIAERQSAGADASEADGAVRERRTAIAEPLEPAEAARSIVVDADVALDLEAVARQWLMEPRELRNMELIQRKPGDAMPL